MESVMFLGGYDPLPLLKKTDEKKKKIRGKGGIYEKLLLPLQPNFGKSDAFDYVNSCD